MSQYLSFFNIPFQYPQGGAELASGFGTGAIFCTILPGNQLTIPPKIRIVP
jgi:hypothetical protein